MHICGHQRDRTHPDIQITCLSLQELMSAIQQQMTTFKERQRHLFHELQHECDLHERALELFAERVDTSAWNDDAAAEPPPAALDAPQSDVEVAPAHAAPNTARSSVRAS